MNGVFNGDPHPGNILLCDNGKIGLIDYGQVKRISVDTRVNYAELILALADDDREEVLNVYKRIGIRTKYMNPDILWSLAAFWNDRDTEDVTRGM
jgi:aarF domain-containing kinase